MTVLVTGATGNVGSNVVRGLRERAVPVRAFVRDPVRAAELLGPGVELAAGDFDEPRSIRRALEGADRVLLSSADGPRKVEHEAAVVDAAAAARVRLIVKASTVDAQAGSPLLPFDWNGRSEDHLRRSGVPAVVLRSAFYMTNLLAAAEQVRAERRLFAPAGEGRIAVIDPRDVAAVAAIVLTEDGHAGSTYALTGGEAVGYERVAGELARATGSPVDYVDVPEEAARRGIAAAGLPDWLVDHMIALFALIRSGRFEQTTDTVRALTGREPRRFADFAREHAGAFVSARPTAAAAQRA